MLKTLKIPATIFTLFLFVTLSSNIAHASENPIDSQSPIANDVTITITNDQTGEVTNITPNEEPNLEVDPDDSINPFDNSSLEAYDVYIPIETTGNVKLLRDAFGNTKTAGGVTAKLNVDYNTSANNEQVKLNKVYGSWKPSNNMYYLTDRKVGAHSGVAYGKTINKTPTTNSFNYTTGFGYNKRVWGQAAPRAWSSAKIHVSGMTATYTIKVEFTYS
ncbi:hypothetical protein HB847_15290 [Listeria booriae]|uniref:WxL domain-containing protein n=1 Tax=Listeria booriae TaxID=1552123 RepID=A0A841Y9X6_9LIST|nr:hypothetical protein [Listeria booriae]MBC1373717.1 hypothetical protein [Listeria booriae]MBC1801614.1 hypothetical protein [Listeria booriae]